MRTRRQGRHVRAAAQRAAMAGILALVAVAPAVAQMLDSATQAVAVYAFDVPRDDLSSVVVRIARISGTPVAFPAGLAQGFMAGPIEGRYTAEAALSQVLNGTGLEIAAGPGGSLTIRPAADPTGVRRQSRTSSSESAF